MKKIFLAACSLLFIAAPESKAALIVTYAGQSQVRPDLFQAYTYILDCLAVEKDCCTVNWDSGEILVYDLVEEPEGPPVDPNGTYTGTIHPESFVEHADGTISIGFD